VDEIVSLVEAGDARRTALPRVCLVIGQLGLGGTEKQVVLLAEGLRRRGIDVTVVVLTAEGPREHALREAGVPVVHLNLRQPGDWRALPCLVAALARLARYLRRSRPDVVHAFLYHSYVLAAPAARLARIPVLVAGRRSLDDFKRGRRLVLGVERIATRMTHLLVANAHAVADRARVTERVRADKLAVIYNGLPPAAFAEAEPARLDTAHPVVLCVANLKEYKGHAHLLDAAALLRDRGLPCTLVLAGEGPERGPLLGQAAGLGIDVRLLGARTDVDRLLARADAVVLPSLTEGMSNAVMEGMAAGRPVVATAVGGTPELLAGGRGVLVAPRDAAGLADAVERVLRDHEYAARLGRAAREWSRSQLHADTMVERHIALYERLLERRCAA
jgi:glycosyltransferase involved in cell wall biosynthesis